MTQRPGLVNVFAKGVSWWLLFFFVFEARVSILMDNCRAGMPTWGILGQNEGVVMDRLAQKPALVDFC